VFLLLLPSFRSDSFHCRVDALLRKASITTERKRHPFYTMVRLTALRAKQARGGFDTASYMTDTSSITNPVELGFSYDSQDHDEDEDDSYFEDYTSYAASSMTGWTTEAEESAFPVAHSKTGLSQQTSNSYENDDVTSCMISAISFEDGSIEASLMDGKNYEKTKKGKGSKLTTIREPLTEKGSSQPAAKAVQFRSPSNISLEGKKTPNLPLSPKSALKSKSVPQVDVKKATSFGSAGPTSPASSTTSSVVTRKPVPPLRDPTMEDSEEDQMWEEDCNYDINPTVMFLILESRDWKECIALLDGKTSEKNSWSLNHLFGGGKPDVNQMKERQKELKAQARTWIVRRERNGFLRWRMLPLHAALAFNAPFDVVLRLYHLYPGAMRCRNDKGMLPIHHVFYYGNEDRVLELFMDVFPEGLTVTDDKGRLPIACTPCDGSDNERRSSILNLYCNFHLSEAKKEAEKANNPPAAPLTVQPQQQLPQQQQQQQQQQGMTGFFPQVFNQQHQQRILAPQQQPLQNSIPFKPLPQIPPSPQPEAALGIAPRYDPTASDYSNLAPYNSVSNLPPKPLPKVPEPQSATDSRSNGPDRYALTNEENSSSVGNKVHGLTPIPEDEALEKDSLGSHEKKPRKGLRKFLLKKR